MLLTGTILNTRYRIVKPLGQGGFGAVYRAWDMNLNKPCAVKENTDTGPEAQNQFSQEATILANLSHPNLPRVIDHFILPGQAQCLVMDFVDGDDLQTILERASGPLPATQAVEWITHVCDALMYLHSRNPPIIHRDIKPANIKITPQGQAVLVDFGIAKVYAPTKKTAIGARGVTKGYSPPEQYGQGMTDARTDIYALGATLYHLLTYSEPPESVQRLGGDVLQPIHRLNSQVSQQLSQAVHKALSLVPAQRFQSVAEFKQSLRPAILVSPPPPPTLQLPFVPAPPDTTNRRLRMMLGCLALVGACGCCGLAALWNAPPEFWQFFGINYNFF